MHIKIPAGLRGSIYQRGKNSYRVQLSLGRGPDGIYDIKRETIRGRQQDAIDLLTRWNVLHLDNALQATVYQTVEEAYVEWLDNHVGLYLTPNTARFYRQRFECDLLPVIGHRRLKDVTLSDLQKTLAKHPTKDLHNKRALSAFFNWCADMDKTPHRFDFRKLKTKARPGETTEKDVWSFEQVRKVYATLTFQNLYDIFIVLGIECGLRPQEILALTWDKVYEDHLVIDRAVKERNPSGAKIGTTKTEQVRHVATTPYLIEKLTAHNMAQQLRILTTTKYNRDANLVVADMMGNVADLGYVRKYVRQVADRAQVHHIPPKNLRSTWVSLMGDLGIPLTVIQKGAGHSSPQVTAKHYTRVFDASLKEAASIYHDHLHGKL